MQKSSKSNQEGNDEFEAWMLVAGEKREGFNYSLFFEQFLDGKQHIFSIREIVNIQVMRELILCSNMLLRMMALLKRSQTM